MCFILRKIILNPFIQVFVALVINLHSNGCNAAMTGLIISRLKDESSIMKMTPEEESWFGTSYNYSIISNMLINVVKPLIFEQVIIYYLSYGF